MTDEEYEKAKKPILDQLNKQSKNKGLDTWEKILANYGISIEQAKKGVYLPQKGMVFLYFDIQKDQWLMKNADPFQN